MIKNKIIFDEKIEPKKIITEGKIIYAIDTENTNVNDETCITYCTSLIEVGHNRTKKSKNLKFNDNDRVNIFTHPNLFWEYILNTEYPTIEMYVFNADFDVENLFPYLFKKYKLKEESEQLIQNRYGFYEKDKKNTFKVPFTYNFIKSKNSIIGLEITLDRINKGKAKPIFRKIKIHDLAKRMTGSLANNVKAYLEYEMSKEGLDYSKFRDFYHTDYTEDELKYIWEDTYYLKELIKKFVYEMGNKKITTGAIALDNYKTTLFNDFLENYNNKKDINYDIYYSYFRRKNTRLKWLIENEKTLNAKQLKELDSYYTYIKENGENSKDEYILNKMCKVADLFEHIYPSLDYDTFHFLYKSYHGGITRINDRKFSEDEWINKEGHSYDINSSYPNSMRYFMLPYGQGIYKKGTAKQKKNHVFVQHLTVQAFSLHEGKEPIIQTPVSKNKDFKETWSKNHIGTIHLYLTNVELEYFKKNYELIGVEYIDYVEFKAKRGLFDKFIDHHYSIKQNAIGPIREFSKLILNSVYGKFGQNAITEYRKTEYNEENNRVDEFILKDEYDNNVQVEVNQVYVPVAIFTTAYSRLKLVNVLNRVNATKGIEWAYTDTDSVYIIGNEDKCNIALGDELDEFKTGELGLWKKEKDFIGIKLIGIKKYIVKIKKDNQIKYLVTLSGINRNYFNIIEMDLLHDENIIGIINPKDSKLINNNKYYTIQDNKNPYVYYDKECTKQIVGAYKSIRKNRVKNGIVLTERIYCILGGQLNGK